MIFVTVGAHYQPFDRLIFLMDLLAPSLGEAFIAQTGHGRYAPLRMKAFAFAPRQTMLKHVREARLIVSHAGIGTLIDAKRAGTPVIIFPRLKRHNEHNNNHQLEIAHQLHREQRPGVRVVFREEDMADALSVLMKGAVEKMPGDFSGRDTLARELKGYFDRL